jgi:hypothetical protein
MVRVGFESPEERILENSTANYDGLLHHMPPGYADLESELCPLQVAASSCEDALIRLRSACKSRNCACG